MKVYISGPMTGIPEFNRPAFVQAKCEMVALGLDVVSPVDVGDELAKKVSNPTWADYMREDIKALVDCDGIFLLPNWEQSRGACVEARIASDLGIRRVDISGAAMADNP